MREHDYPNILKPTKTEKKTCYSVVFYETWSMELMPGFVPLKLQKTLLIVNFLLSVCAGALAVICDVFKTEYTQP